MNRPTRTAHPLAAGGHEARCPTTTACIPRSVTSHPSNTRPPTTFQPETTTGPLRLNNALRQPRPGHSAPGCGCGGGRVRPIGSHPRALPPLMVIQGPSTLIKDEAAAQTDGMVMVSGRLGKVATRTAAHGLKPGREDMCLAFGEFGLTATFMFAVYTLTRWGIGTADAGATPTELRMRCAVVSMLVGLVIVGFIVSAPGRWTGAHMNPAITLALFVYGRTPGRRAVSYLVAQAAGSVAAAALARLAWGTAMSEGPTRWAVVQPAPGWGGTAVTLVEAAVLAAIVAVMCPMLDRRPAWLLPWIMGVMFGLQGAVFGTFTGGSANPVRQLGPALFSGQIHLLAAYLIAPVGGGVLAAWVARRASVRRAVHRDDVRSGPSLTKPGRRSRLACPSASPGGGADPQGALAVIAPVPVNRADRAPCRLRRRPLHHGGRRCLPRRPRCLVLPVRRSW